MEPGIATGKVLIVDDEPEVRSVLRRSLLESDYECETASDAQDALAKIRNDRYSLVLSDVNMPGMSGIELLRYIKTHDPAVSVIMITGLHDLATAVDSLRLGACDYITKPFDVLTVRRAVARALALHHLELQQRGHQEELERLIRERTVKLNGALQDVKESYRFTLETLVAALDAREHETRAHSQRVREYACLLARRLGVGGNELIQIGRGALLHDIGKIGVPDAILLKPAGLTKDEWVQMKRHPRVGYDILKGIKFLAPAAEIVLTHQERWDGNGYPNGLRGSDIPLGSRIFAVVDTLDAMTSDRPYRKALPFAAAHEEVDRCSGTQFDPEVAKAFLSADPSVWIEASDFVNRRYRSRNAVDVLCPT